MIDRNLIESMIDAVCDGSASVDDVASHLTARPLPETVMLDESEADVPPACIQCGNPSLDFGMLESEDGEVPYFHCPDCDLGYVADVDAMNESEDAEGDEDGIFEAAIDPENPECPNCGSDHLDVVDFQMEGEDEPTQAIVCDNCGCGMIPADDESED